MDETDIEQLAHIEKASKLTRQQRLDVCKTCERYNVEEDRCLECGCIMFIKVTIPMMTCPIGKW